MRLTPHQQWILYSAKPESLQLKPLSWLEFKATIVAKFVQILGVAIYVQCQVKIISWQSGFMCLDSINSLE